MKKRGKNVEKRAIEIIMKYEKSQGRKPVDMSKKRCGYDIQSGNRFIEVKGLKKESYTWASMQETLLRRLGEDIAHYYIYMVYNINNHPKLKIVEPDDIFKNMKTYVRLHIPASVIKHGKDVDLHM